MGSTNCAGSGILPCNNKPGKTKKVKDTFQDLSAGSAGGRDYGMESSVLSQSQPSGLESELFKGFSESWALRECLSQSE